MLHDRPRRDAGRATEADEPAAPGAGGETARRDGEPAGRSDPPAAAPADSDGQDEGGDEGAEPAPRRLWPRVLLMIVLLPVAAVGAVAGYRAWAESRHFETTDDAFVDGHTSNVASQVAGRVEAVAVRDNQRVGAGDVLLRIDARDYEVRLRQAEAQRANAAAQVLQMAAQRDLQQATIAQGETSVRAAEADALQAKQDYARYSSILPAAVTRQEVDRSSASAKSTAAKVEGARYALAAAKAQLEAIKAQIAGAEATLKQNDESVANALLQLSYTRIAAPVAGRVTRRTVEVGNYVNPGQALLAVVPDELFVTANFKETQLADMAVGQPVDIRIDAYPRQSFPGRVDSFQTGTGSAFSSLPAENATGNYVKVVQRLPVKIVFDGPAPAGVRLAPGLSVQPRVRVR